MDSRIAQLLQCPTVSKGVRCDGQLIERENALTCDKCSSQFRVVKRGVPILRAEDQEADQIWYEGNYAARSRTRDLAEDSYGKERVIVRDAVARHHVNGPALDVGCGTGIFASDLPGFVGLDYSLNAITSPGTEDFAFVCASAESIPFRDGVFGCVFSINALEHVPRVDLAFEEIDRVLQPGGFIILKPAWHCTRYQTELLPIKKYGELKWGQKITKAMLPILTSRPYKLANFLPWRVWRRFTAQKRSPLHFVPLTPNFSEWIADSDATASIDCHEGILFFESRGYQNFSHKSLARKLLAGHDWIVLQKPLAS